VRRFVFLAVLVVSACSGIGIDGLRADALQQVSTPAMDDLIATGTVTYDAFAGGVLGTPTEQGTWSGAGWSSTLTGVWVDKHGVEFNVFDDARFDEYPHFFARIREQSPDAYLSSFVTWGPINESILASAEADEAFSPEGGDSSPEGDIAVTAAVVAHMGAETADVVFVHLNEVDRQGHSAGFSPAVPQYVQALEVVDAQIGQMLDAVRARPSYDQEDWLVVVTSDHGGTADKVHGGQSNEERTIPIIVSGGAARSGYKVSPGPGHTAVPPTVLRHLGLTVDPAWGWESEPFGL
jgi:hypothetical protein